MAPRPTSNALAAPGGARGEDAPNRNRASPPASSQRAARLARVGLVTRDSVTRSERTRDGRTLASGAFRRALTRRHAVPRRRQTCSRRREAPADRTRRTATAMAAGYYYASRLPCHPRRARPIGPPRLRDPRRRATPDPNGREMAGTSPPPSSAAHSRAVELRHHPPDWPASGGAPRQRCPTRTDESRSGHLDCLPSRARARARRFSPASLRPEESLCEALNERTLSAKLHARVSWGTKRMVSLFSSAPFAVGSSGTSVHLRW